MLGLLLWGSPIFLFSLRQQVLLVLMALASAQAKDLHCFLHSKK